MPAPGTGPIVVGGGAAAFLFHSLSKHGASPRADGDIDASVAGSLFGEADGADVRVGEPHPQWA